MISPLTPRKDAAAIPILEEPEAKKYAQTRKTTRNKKLNEKIKKNWENLSDEEIEFYHERPEAFYAAIKQKYGMFESDAVRSIQQLKSGFFGWFN